jgi:uncharacterized membrane protein
MASMFGIQGLDPTGAVHMLLGLVALGLGSAVVTMEKGTPRHRRIGLAYVAVMLGLNGTAFLLYGLWGRWGPFHTLAVVSLATVGIGLLSAWLQRPRRWVEVHARFMAWSYAGVLAAFFSEIGARLPGVGLLPGVLVPSTVVIGIAAVVIHRRVPRLAASFGAPEAARATR